MKRILLFGAVFLITFPVSLSALTIDFFKVLDLDNFQTQTNIQTWIAGGQLSLIEDFESSSLGWHDSIETDIGKFTAGGLVGSGSTSDPSDLLRFELRDSENAGRFNTSIDGEQFLDSADITEITLDLLPGLDIRKLFFFMTDPGDVGAITSVAATAFTSTIPDDVNAGQANGSLWFVGIDAGAEYISKIVWSTGNVTNDGFGLDDFTKVVPVPEPGTLILFGSGLASLALYRRRSMNR